jgi:uncharacterized membrane protein
MTSTIHADVVVDVPVGVAYDQWTQFESFPDFLSGVESVKQLDDTKLHWVVTVGGVEREFDATITEQRPDEVIAWRSTQGELHSGRVVFTPESAAATRVDVEMAWEPEGFVEKVGAALQIDDAQVKSDLKNFKRLIEERGTAEGAWRGEVHGGRVTDDGDGDFGRSTPSML